MKIEFPENYKPVCFDCGKRRLQIIWLLKGRKSMSGPLGIIGILCSDCKELAARVSKEGHTPGWDRVAELAGQYGFTLAGMAGCWMQAKSGQKWKEKIIKSSETRKTYVTARTRGEVDYG